MSNNKKIISSKRRILDESTPFAIRESFNQLRTNLMYTAKKGDGCPVYAVSSAEAGVGKSTVISNLALSFAQLEKKVLLVDADMRRPVQHQIFGYDKKRTGLSELLSGITNDDKSAICNPAPCLYLLTSGGIPPYPSELISSKVFKDLIAKWRGEYDAIFIDLPPVGIVSDPLSVADAVDGYVIVTMANKSDARHVNSACAALEGVGAKVLGTVVNGTSLKGDTYGKYSKDYAYNYYSSDQD